MPSIRRNVRELRLLSAIPFLLLLIFTASPARALANTSCSASAT